MGMRCRTSILGEYATGIQCMDVVEAKILNAKSIHKPAFGHAVFKTRQAPLSSVDADRFLGQCNVVSDRILSSLTKVNIEFGRAQIIQLKNSVETLNPSEPLGEGKTPWHQPASEVYRGKPPKNDCYGEIERVWPWSGLVSFPLGGRIEQAYFHRESVLIDNCEISPSLNLMDILRSGMSASLRVIPSHTGTDIRFIAIDTVINVTPINQNTNEDHQNMNEDHQNKNEDHQNKAEDLPRSTALPHKESNETIKVPRGSHSCGCDYKVGLCWALGPGNFVFVFHWGYQGAVDTMRISSQTTVNL
ncbi:unnamed protein product [Timema podura]|uniref:Uncharacterized protein n=1 Tax=Timema podura TaxID=61482 RepID=A0ABN7NTP9_TIMPD|nr:unnamed protein product [Timema podura]